MQPLNRSCNLPLVKVNFASFEKKKGRRSLDIKFQKYLPFYNKDDKEHTPSFVTEKLTV